MDLREALQALRARWWLPLVGLIVGGTAAFCITSLLIPPRYTAATQMFVSTAGATSQDVIQGSQYTQDRVVSYAQLLEGEELATRVIARLGLETTPQELTGQVTAQAAADTVLIDVAVEDASPQRAQAIADALGTEFSTLVSELETPVGGGPPLVKVTITDRPEVPARPSSPQPVRNIAVGLIAGTLVGALGALARERLDRSVKDAGVAAELARVPVIGTIRRDPAMERGRATIDRGAPNLTAEDYRKLRANLQFLNVDQPPKVVMVSSAMPSEGKSTVIVNLALLLADAGLRVTIVDADLRRPAVASYLGLIGGAGLTNVLAGAADVDDVLQRHGELDLTVLAAGPTPPNPGELLASTQMAALLDKLRAGSDYVLVDAPPLLPVADSTGLAVMMDGVLLCVRHGKTTREQLVQARTNLDRVGATSLGVIINVVPPQAQIASSYGDRYGAQ